MEAVAYDSEKKNTSHSAKQLIVDQQWTSLEAWLMITARSSETFHGISYEQATASSDSEQVFEINIRAFKTVAFLEVTYGICSRALRVDASLAVSRILRNDDNMRKAILYNDLDQIIGLFKTGVYNPNDVFESGLSLLNVSD